jgi:hypothetical protein
VNRAAALSWIDKTRIRWMSGRRRRRDGRRPPIRAPMAGPQRPVTPKSGSAGVIGRSNAWTPAHAVLRAASVMSQPNEFGLPPFPLTARLVRDSRLRRFWS